MTIGRREAIMVAFAAKFSSLIDASTPVIPAGKVRVVSRRLVPYDQAASKPALFISEATEHYEQQSESLQKQAIHPLLFLYIDAGRDQEIIPATQLNNLLDAIDLCLAPDDVVQGKCTLGGLVSHCFISGEIPKIPGDLDGEGMAVIPAHILLPD